MEGQEFGAVLPQQANPIDTYRQIQQQNLEQKRYNDQRQTELTKYIVDKIDPHAYATGDPVIDPIVNSIAQDTLQNTMKGIKSGVPFSDLLLGTSNATSKMNQYHQRATAHDALLKHRAEELKKDPSLDVNGYLKLAKYKFTHNPDNSMKTVEQMNPNEDNFDEIMRENPQLIKSLTGLDNTSLKKDNIDYKSRVTNKVNGIDVHKTIAGSYNPFSHELLDENGNPTTKDKGDAVSVGLKKEYVRLKDGTPIPIVPKSVYSHFVTAPSAHYGLIHQAKEIIKDHPELTEDEAVRAAYYNHLNENNTSGIGPVDSGLDESQKWRADQALTRQAISQANNVSNILLRDRLSQERKDRNAPVEYNPYYDMASYVDKNFKKHELNTPQNGIPLLQQPPELPLGELPTTTAEAILKHANALRTIKKGKLTADDVWLGKDDNGYYGVDKTGNRINLTPNDFKTTKVKQATNAQPAKQTKKNDPLGLF